MLLDTCKSKIRKPFFHPKPPIFAHYSLINSSMLTLIRTISAFYLTGFYIYDISSQPDYFASLLSRMIFLTDISFFFSWLYFVVIIQSRFLKVHNLDQYAQILLETILCAQIFIVVAYSTIIYWLEEIKDPMLKNINWHGGALLLLSLDFIFNSFRFIPSQVYAFIIYGLIYMFCINLPYSLAVTPVYGQASNQKGWMTYAFIVAYLVGGTLIFMGCRLVYTRLKQKKILASHEQTVNMLSKLQYEQISNDVTN